MSGPEGMYRLAFENMPAGVTKEEFAKLCRTACVATGARGALLTTESLG